MKFLNAPRQPFVGLSLMTAIGIIIADAFPLSGATLTVLTIVLAIWILILAWRPISLATYAVVGIGFFLVHNLETSNTEGQQLDDELGGRARVVTAIGAVITEPKVAPSGFATFLLKLKSIEFEGQTQSTHAVWQVRWKGTPEFGDELKLFGMAEVIPPPRNPGEFDMRAYLARHDVRRMLFVRYTEDGALIRHGGGNQILRLAQKSRAWMQNAIFSTGFQLSFAVVGAIILLADPFAGFLQRWTAPDPFLPRGLLRGPRRWMPAGLEWLCRGTGVSLAAWVGSLPLVLWYFYIVTPISLVANLIVVPIAFFILAIALLSLLSTPLLPGLAVIFNNGNWLLAQIVIGIVQFLANVPGGHFYVEHPHWSEKLVAKITVLDVGAGAAVHLQTGSANWLFDCGNERNYQRVVREYLHWAGINRLSGLLLSHGDALHLGGTTQLLDDFPRIRVVDNAAPDHSAVHRRLQQLFREHGIEPDNLAAGDSFRLSPDVTARVLFPPRNFSSPVADDQASVIHLLVAPATWILFMSDSGIKTEQALLASGLNLQSDIIIKGQHHSGESGSDAFLDATRPRLIIATSRDFPGYERIRDAWAENVRKRGIKLFRQDDAGAVTVSFRQDSWEAQSYLTGEVLRSSNH